jgi:hypothetical protein
MTRWTRELSQDIDKKLAAIAKLLPARYELTLIARYTGDDLNDADVIYSVDDLEKVIESIRKLKDREPFARSGERY